MENRVLKRDSISGGRSRNYDRYEHMLCNLCVFEPLSKPPQTRWSNIYGFPNYSLLIEDSRIYTGAWFFHDHSVYRLCNVTSRQICALTWHSVTVPNTITPTLASTPTIAVYATNTSVPPSSQSISNGVIGGIVAGVVVVVLAIVGAVLYYKIYRTNRTAENNKEPEAERLPMEQTSELIG